MATSKIIKPNNEAPDELEKEIAGVRHENSLIPMKFERR